MYIIWEEHIIISTRSENVCTNYFVYMIVMILNSFFCGITSYVTMAAQHLILMIVFTDDY